MSKRGSAYNPTSPHNHFSNKLAVFMITLLVFLISWQLGLALVVLLFLSSRRSGL